MLKRAACDSQGFFSCSSVSAVSIKTLRRLRGSCNPVCECVRRTPIRIVRRANLTSICTPLHACKKIACAGLKQAKREARCKVQADWLRWRCHIRNNFFFARHLFSMIWTKNPRKPLISKCLDLSWSAVRTYICSLLHIYRHDRDSVKEPTAFRTAGPAGMTTCLGAPSFAAEARHPSFMDKAKGELKSRKNVRERNESNHEHAIAEAGLNLPPQSVSSPIAVSLVARRKLGATAYRVKPAENSDRAYCKSCSGPWLSGN